MTSPVRKILIIGGGFSGMAAAIHCARHGMEVDLVEIDPGWRSYGAGISIGGATLRALDTLGVLPRFLEEGSGHDGASVFTPDGKLLAELPTPRLVRPDVPGGGAIMRPVLPMCRCFPSSDEWGRPRDRGYLLKRIAQSLSR